MVTEIIPESNRNYTLRAPVVLNVTRGLITNCVFNIEFKIGSGHIDTVDSIMKFKGESAHITDCIFNLREVEEYSKESSEPTILREVNLLRPVRKMDG